MRARAGALLLGLGCAFVACSNLPVDRPLPPVASAPAALARLRIHVENATDARAREAHEDSVTGYTMLVRAAIQRALERAGYVVIVEPNDPHDLVARIHTDYQTLSHGVGGTLVTSLTLIAPGGMLEQLSGEVIVDEHADIDPAGAVRLVEAIARSTRVERYSSALARPDVPCAPSGPQIAGPGPGPDAGPEIAAPGAEPDSR